jgi:site-specific DNA-methyltransferase (adenine-specific)
MVEDLVLVKLDAAKTALMEAKTIQETKSILDIAVAAETYAKRQKLGEEAIHYATSIKVEALAQLGRMLKETLRATGGEYGGKTKIDGTRLEPSNPQPTLSDLGLDKKTSKLARDIASLPDEQLEKVKSRVSSLHQVQKEIKKAHHQEERVEAQKAITTEARKSLEAVCDLRVCSCAELLRSGIKPNAVITDPPYPKEFLPLFTELAEACKFANVPLVAVMSGQSYLPEVLQRLCEHLNYRWTLAYLTPGGQAVQLWKAEVNTFWKPILLFGDAMDWLGDVVTSKVNDNDKRFHEWGQSESGMADLVERLTKPGQLVCDPFLGGGATAIAALALGRRFVGCDISAECIETTRQRVEAALCKEK